MNDPTKPDNDNGIPTEETPPSDVTQGGKYPWETARADDETVVEKPPPKEKKIKPKPRRVVKPIGKPMRLVFGEMVGVLFLVWIPVLIAFFLPWSDWLPKQWIFGEISIVELVVAVIIALPPWIVLLLHLIRGRMLDGVLDMLLWAIWECGIMILLCVFYPNHAEHVIYNASNYWEEMQAWLVDGGGREGDPSQWWSIHLMYLGLDLICGFILGLPALILGVLQLNWMNFYVAQMLMRSDNVLLTLPIAWHFWSVIRVAGFIVLAVAMFQLFMKLVFRAPGRYIAFWMGIIFGLILVIGDALLKWQFAEDIRQILLGMCYL